MPPLTAKLLKSHNYSARTKGTSVEVRTARSRRPLGIYLASWDIPRLLGYTSPLGIYLPSWDIPRLLGAPKLATARHSSPLLPPGADTDGSRWRSARWTSGRAAQNPTRGLGAGHYTQRPRPTLRTVRLWTAGPCHRDGAPQQDRGAGSPRGRPPGASETAK